MIDRVNSFVSEPLEGSVFSIFFSSQYSVTWFVFSLDAGDQREDVYIGSHMPCPENLNGYCIHGKCEFIYSTQKASCR